MVISLVMQCLNQRWEKRQRKQAASSAKRQDEGLVKIMKDLKDFLKGDLLGVHLAVNIIAAGLTHHSKLSGVEIGLRRVGEVMLGCVMGLLVTWLMSKIWPLPEVGKDEGATKPSSP